MKYFSSIILASAIAGAVSAHMETTSCKSSTESGAVMWWTKVQKIADGEASPENYFGALTGLATDTDFKAVLMDSCANRAE